MTQTLKTVLIVQSLPEELARMAQVLAAEYRLAFAWTGREALAAARRQAPALVLLDVGLPDLDGLAVYRALKADPDTASIPALLLGTRAELQLGAAALHRGDGCLLKPLSAQALLEGVRDRLATQEPEQVLDTAYRDALNMLRSAGGDRANKHPLRMAAYAAALAQAAGWSAQEVAQIHQAAALHDIGELGIPDAILLKPLKLDDREWEVMKTHCRIGHDLLARHRSPVLQLAARIALHHHEKWDGSGYPEGLAGQAIPEAARIVAVADVFNALTTRRPYRQAWPVETAMAALQSAAGQHLDPQLVRLFASILPKVLEIQSGLDEFCEERRLAA